MKSKRRTYIFAGIVMTIVVAYQFFEDDLMVITGLDAEPLWTVVLWSTVGLVCGFLLILEFKERPVDFEFNPPMRLRIYSGIFLVCFIVFIASKDWIGGYFGLSNRQMSGLGLLVGGVAFYPLWRYMGPVMAEYEEAKERRAELKQSEKRSDNSD